MAQRNDAVTLEDVLKLAKKLSPGDKVRLIERLAPAVERDLTTRPGGRNHSLLGLLNDLGPAPSAEVIDATRREAWASFPRDEV